MTLTSRPRRRKQTSSTARLQRVLESYEGYNSLGGRTTRNSILGHGMRQLPGSLPGNPIVIEDSADEIGVHHEEPPPPSAPHPKPVRASQANITDWLDNSVRSSSTQIEVHPRRYRSTASSSARTGTPTDPIANASRRMQQLRLNKDLPWFDTPILSSERQPVSR